MQGDDRGSLLHKQRLDPGSLLHYLCNGGGQACITDVGQPIGLDALLPIDLHEPFDQG